MAEPGPLVATKLHSVMNRRTAKEGTDLLDIVRLVLDPHAGPTALEQLSASSELLRSDGWVHANLWFDTRAARTLRLIRSAGGLDVDLPTLDLVRDLLRSTFAVTDARFGPRGQTAVCEDRHGARRVSQVAERGHTLAP